MNKINKFSYKSIKKLNENLPINRFGMNKWKIVDSKGEEIEKFRSIPSAKNELVRLQKIYIGEELKIVSIEE